ncbi:hypothetical protein [Alkalihalobacillus sp. R86527]|uniref:hypothetical protein n=1 Tax=Alkalihalobacillus sp. R86527 TaxID=3093863 RepID=UPI0036730CFF
MENKTKRSGLNKDGNIFVVLFLGQFIVDLIMGNPFTWGEYFFISLFAMLFQMFFSWAWKSKEYKKKEQ